MTHSVAIVGICALMCVGLVFYSLFASKMPGTRRIIFFFAGLLGSLIFTSAFFLRFAEAFSTSPDFQRDVVIGGLVLVVIIVIAFIIYSRKKRKKKEEEERKRQQGVIVNFFGNGSSNPQP